MCLVPLAVFLQRFLVIGPHGIDTLIKRSELDHQRCLDPGDLAAVRCCAVERNACRQFGISDRQLVYDASTLAKARCAHFAVCAVERLKILETCEEIVQERLLVEASLHLTTLIVVARITAE